MTSVNALSRQYWGREQRPVGAQTRWLLQSSLCSMDQPTDHPVERASTTEGLPISPSMGPAIEAADVEYNPALVDRRVIMLCTLCIALAAVAALVAHVLVRL